MELLFDHILGKQENQDLVICRPMAYVSRDEEIDAVEQGWLALDHDYKDREVWYQSRSTRINLRKTAARFRKWEIDGEPLKIKVIHADEMVHLLGLQKIYTTYMKKKQYKADYNPFWFYHKRDRFALFYTGTPDNILGFTKQKIYKYQEDMMDDGQTPAAVESVVHCNRASISAISLDMEIQYAFENNCDYYYLGSGYEKSSEYKASWKGFEWWTGTEWSTNRRLYRRLCRRDSKLSSFSDLESL